MGFTYTIWVLFIVCTAAFSYINYRFIRLPATIGIMFLALAFSVLLVLLGQLHPSFLHLPTRMIGSVDFEAVLMKVMLSFLLFAGSIHLDIGQLRRESVPIAVFSTLGVIISTAIIGVLTWLVFSLFHMPVPLIHCLVFGALLSPTDPVAVLGILKQARIPSSLEIKITGESLFNDGVGVVVFITLLEIAGSGITQISAWQVGWLFLKEAGGGIIWGWLLGYGCYLALKSIDHYQVEVLITIALVMAGYWLADLLHVSGLLAMVVAGIFVGNKGKKEAMSPLTRDYVTKFWELIDEILNALLFLLIGFEVLVLKFSTALLWIGFLSIGVALVARFLSVLLPTFVLSYWHSFEKSMIPVLTWGGLRGGISVALALSLPPAMHRNEFVTITYIIVVFSILVQGLTIGKLARRMG